MTCSRNDNGCGGSSAGNCAPGFGSTDSGLTCTPCVQGTYKTTVGNVACVTCSPYGTGCGGVSPGVCNAGYYNSNSTVPGATCTACGSGTYKTTAGNTACMTCSRNDNGCG